MSPGKKISQEVVRPWDLRQKMSLQKMYSNRPGQIACCLNGKQTQRN